MNYGEWRKEPDDLENRPTSLGNWLYEQLWSRVGRRPWTYIMLDAWHSNPKAWVAVFMSLSSALWFFGFVLGHVFW